MIDKTRLQTWLQLPDATRLNIFNETARRLGLPATAVEKDWWVVHTLALVFSMECAPALIFKGGTSLSKGWGLIQRFSEDIDLAIDREYLGFPGDQTRQTIKKLRKASYKFMTETFLQELTAKFDEAGFRGVTVDYQHTGQSDQDPVIVGIYYSKLTETNTYQKRDIMLEVGCRSLREPTTNRTFTTMVAEQFNDRPFANAPITVRVVNPERTFLEKVFLLHEEFQKTPGKIRVDRLSRHLYDIDKLNQAGFADIALQDTDLYQIIVDHRRRFTSLSEVNYDNHSPDKLAFIPPAHLLPAWEADYRDMRENMIYGEPLGFTELIQKLLALQTHINNNTLVAKPKKTVFQQTEVGEIPSDWEVKTLGEVGKWRGGGTPSKANPDYWKGNIPWVSPKDMRGIRIKETQDYISEKAIIESSTNLIAPNSVLIVTRSGILRNYIPIATNSVPVAINQDLKALSVKESYSNAFIFQALIGFQNTIKEATVKSGTTVESIDFKAFKNFQIPFPPTLAEQTAIATALTDADALITQLSTLIAKKKAIKQGAMQELLTPKEGWEEKKLGEIIDNVQLGGNYPNVARITSHPLIKMGNIQRGNISIQKIEYIQQSFQINKRDKLLYGDLLFNTRNTLELVGKVSIWRNELKEAYFNSNLMRIKFRSEFVASNFFMNYVFNTKYAIDKLKDIATGTTSVAAIYTRDLFCLEISLPTKFEQIRITHILSDMDADIEKLEQLLAKQKMLKQGMMQVLLTGKIRLV